MVCGLETDPLTWICGPQHRPSSQILPQVSREALERGGGTPPFPIF